MLLWPLPLQSECKAGNRPPHPATPHPATPCGLRLVRTQTRLPLLSSFTRCSLLRLTSPDREYRVPCPFNKVTAAFVNGFSPHLACLWSPPSLCHQASTCLACLPACCMCTRVLLQVVTPLFAPPPSILPADPALKSTAATPVSHPTPVTISTCSWSFCFVFTFQLSSAGD